MYQNRDPLRCKGSFTYLQIRGGIHIILFLFLHKNICCGYSLEVPHRGTSNEYPQHMYAWRNKKIISTFQLKGSALSGAMCSAVKGLKVLLINKETKSNLHNDKQIKWALNQCNEFLMNSKYVSSLLWQRLVQGFSLYTGLQWPK